MIERHRAVTVTLASAAIIGAALAGAALSAADPADPAPAPVTTVPVAPPAAPADPQGMTPNQPPVPAADPAVAPAAPVLQPSVPEIQNPTYGSGGGGGVFGTLKDLWHQAQNPYYAPDEVMGSGGGAPPAARSRPGTGVAARLHLDQRPRFRDPVDGLRWRAGDRSAGAPARLLLDQRASAARLPVRGARPERGSSTDDDRGARSRAVAGHGQRAVSGSGAQDGHDGEPMTSPPAS